MVRTAAAHINEHVRQKENAEKMLAVAGQITGLPAGFSLLEEGRALVKEGMLDKVCRRANKPFYVVLCTDVLIYGTRQAGSERVKFHRLVQLSDSSFQPTHPDSGPNAFCILASPKSFVLVAPSAYLKSQWVEKLREVYASCAPSSSAAAGGASPIAYDDSDSDENIGGGASASTAAAPCAPASAAPKEQHATLWQPDNSVVACLACGKKFDAFRTKCVGAAAVVVVVVVGGGGGGGGGGVRAAGAGNLVVLVVAPLVVMRVRVHSLPSA